jgi:SAM-dependent methyltransferase
MDILNQLSSRRFREVDDLLAFISIYDDSRRTRAYRSLLRSHAKLVRGAVCLEGGCGLGLFAAELARLGARKVYAVEQNPLLAKLARARFQRLPKSLCRRIELVEQPLQQFRPPVHVNLLVHEFYGQLLYDEDLWVLDHLRFRPDYVLPDGGELRAGTVSSRLYSDRIVTAEVVEKLDGVLVSGLFEGESRDLRQPVLQWRFGEGLKPVKHNLHRYKGDLLCLGLVVTHKGKKVCEAGRCPNWSFVWTMRRGNQVFLRFRRAEVEMGMECRFGWKR